MRMIYKRSSGTGDEKLVPGEGAFSGNNEDICHQNTLRLSFDQDRDCLPHSLPDGQEIERNESDSEVARKRRRRASPEVANVALEDLAKYFDHTLLEASRNLKVGLTALKKKCRELGISSLAAQEDQIPRQSC